ncbi:MAG: immunoglobulin domain-containing protein, partial [Phycisphaerales bacterium]
ISGATAASFTISSVAAADAASYDCVVTNSCGTVTSAAATLTISAAPTITTQPSSRSACPGRSTTFTVVATGSPTFQWRKGGVNISGATAASFTIPSVSAADAGSYDCVVTNACGSVTSTSATLTALIPPSFTTQPVSRSACAGRPTTFTVAVTGTQAITFQWRKGGVNIAGATSASYTIPSVAAVDAGSYDCIATNLCSSVTSSAATLAVTTSVANDLVANAQLLLAGVALAGDTACATVDSADAPVCAAQTVSAPGLWYRLAGTGTSVTVSLCGSSFDTRLSAFCGSPGSFTCVAGNNDACGPQSSVSFCTQSGADYFILVHGVGTAAGPFTILASASQTPCTNPVACLPLGACCVDNGCTQLTAQQCDQLGGTFLGVGTPCDSVSYTDLFRASGPFPVAIPDLSQVTATINAPAGSGDVDGLGVRLGLAHTAVRDLVITLTRGSTSVTLVNRPASGADLDGVYTFSDFAASAFADAALGVSAIAPDAYRPAGSLATFNGHPLAGLWTISVRDAAAGDVGQLRSFELVAAATSPACNACPPCVADYNLDGGVDSEDITSFFDAWERSQSCADVNQDGGIDFGDATDFFAAWENGGC